MQRVEYVEAFEQRERTERRFQKPARNRTPPGPNPVDQPECLILPDSRKSPASSIANGEGEGKLLALDTAMTRI